MTGVRFNTTTLGEMVEAASIFIVVLRLMLLANSVSRRQQDKQIDIYQSYCIVSLDLVYTACMVSTDWPR